MPSDARHKFVEDTVAEFAKANFPFEKIKLCLFLKTKAAFVKPIYFVFLSNRWKLNILNKISGKTMSVVVDETTDIRD